MGGGARRGWMEGDWEKKRAQAIKRAFVDFGVGAGERKNPIG